MLHDKRNKKIQIRLSDQEIQDLLNFCSRFPGFTTSQVLRGILLGTIYESNKDKSLIDQLQYNKVSEKEIR